MNWLNWLLGVNALLFIWLCFEWSKSGFLNMLFKMLLFFSGAANGFFLLKNLGYIFKV